MIVRPHQRAARSSQRGFAVLIVIVLLAIMAALASGNNVALGHLKQELRLIEQRQLQRYGTVTATNHPAVGAPASSRDVTVRKPQIAEPPKQP